MTAMKICLFYILSVSIFPVRSALPPSLRNPLPVIVNKIADINYTCDSDNFNITLKMRSPFKGLIFAKDFAQECKTIGKFYLIVLIKILKS